MFENFFKIDVPMSSGESALIRCLRFSGAGYKCRQLFESWVAKEMHLPLQDEKVKERVEFVLQQKEKLNQIESEADRNLLLNFLARLLSAKFSLCKQADVAISLALDKLVYCFLNKAPIIFIFGFGGYKNHNSPSFPEVDWAELFHMKRMITYLFPIIATYKYGVKFEYESEEIAIQFNNVPQETTDKYGVSFDKLLRYFCKNIKDKNGLEVDFKQVRARDFYNFDDLMSKMKIYYPDMKKVFEDLSEDEKQVWQERAKRNFVVKGIKDYSRLSDDEMENVVVEARITNECFLAADYDLRLDFWERPNAISLFGTWGKKPCASPTDGGLRLKSTSCSDTDFWIGTGVFKLDGNNNILQEMILSHSQYEAVKDKIQFMKNEDEELVKVSKNFETIKYLR